MRFSRTRILIYSGLVLLITGAGWASRVFQQAMVHELSAKIDALQWAVIGPQICMTAGVVLLVYALVIYCLSRFRQSHRSW